MPYDPQSGWNVWHTGASTRMAPLYDLARGPQGRWYLLYLGDYCRDALGFPISYLDYASAVQGTRVHAQLHGRQVDASHEC